MSMPRRLWFAVFSATLALAGLAVAPATAQADNPAQAASLDWQYRQPNLDDFNGNQSPNSFPGGVAYVACIHGAADNPAVAVFAPSSGTPTATVAHEATNSTGGGTSCNDQEGRTADKDGNIYAAEGPAGNSSGDPSKIYSWTKAGQLRWTFTLPTQCGTTDARHYATRMRMGADGNLYFIEVAGSNCPQNTMQLLSLDAKTGVKRFAVGASGQRIDALSLEPYDKGLVLRATNTLVYFDYDGNELSMSNQLPSAAESTPVWDYQVFPDRGSSTSYDGHTAVLLFDNSVPVAGKLVLTGVQLYSPQGLVWSKPLPRINFSSAEISILPDGGMVVRYQTFDDSVDPFLTTTSLIGLDKDGNQRWTLLVPSAPTALESYTSRLYGADVNGNVVVQDQYTESDPHGVGSEDERFFLIDGVTGTIKQLFDTASVADDAGHFNFSQEEEQFAFGDGHLYVRLYTTSYEGSYGGDHLYAIKMPGLGLDYPRGAFFNAPTTPDQPTPPVQIVRSFAAVGDSFIVGEGDRNNGFLRGNCHQSTTAWPTRVADKQANNLHLNAFPACSGATTQDMLKGGTNQPEQITKIPVGTNEVAVSIGGNDVGFSSLIYACLFIECSSRKASTEKAITQLSGKNELPKVYGQIRKRVGKGSVIYVMGYPQVVPNSSCSVANMGLNAAASLFLIGGNGTALARLVAKDLNISYAELIRNLVGRKLTFSAAEAKVANQITNDLNAKIAATVKAQKDTNLVFINPNYKGSPFTGHTLCTKTPYFNGLYINVQHPSAALGDLRMSFHPNHNGTAAYAKVFEDFRNKRNKQ
jgi:hypothetical protein